MPWAIRSRLDRAAGRIRMLRERRSMPEYFDALAPVYDDWWQDRGRFEPGAREGWAQEVDCILHILGSLEPAHTIDAGCGTGFLTQALPGPVVGLDLSERMLEIARRRAPRIEFIHGDATKLPFPDGSFERVFASGLLTHLEPQTRERFLHEAGRVADELVAINGSLALLADEEPEGRPPIHEGEAVAHETRVGPEGSRYRLYKRWVTAERLAQDLGGGEVLHDGHYFVMVRARLRG